MSVADAVMVRKACCSLRLSWVAFDFICVFLVGFVFFFFSSHKPHSDFALIPVAWEMCIGDINQTTVFKKKKKPG